MPITQNDRDRADRALRRGAAPGHTIPACACFAKVGKKNPACLHGVCMEAIEHVAEAIADERAECAKLAAYYGGRDAVEIAELISYRNNNL